MIEYILAGLLVLITLGSNYVLVAGPSRYPRLSGLFLFVYSGLAFGVAQRLWEMANHSQATVTIEEVIRACYG